MKHRTPFFWNKGQIRPSALKTPYLPLPYIFWKLWTCSFIWYHPIYDIPIPEKLPDNGGETKRNIIICQFSFSELLRVFWTFSAVECNNACFSKIWIYWWNIFDPNANNQQRGCREQNWKSDEIFDILPLWNNSWILEIKMSLRTLHMSPLHVRGKLHLLVQKMYFVK